MRWRYGRRLRQQARDLRDKLGDQVHPGSNGRARGLALQTLIQRFARRSRRIRLALAALALIMILGLAHRNCAVYYTTQARIDEAERFIRDQAAEQGWTEEDVAYRIERLHRRYRIRSEGRQ